MGDPIVVFPLSSLGPAIAEPLSSEAVTATFCAAVALMIVAAFLQTPPRGKDRFMFCLAFCLARLVGFAQVEKGPIMILRSPAR
jgi:hypothetical protein